MINSDKPQAVHLADYAPPAFLVQTVDLDVDIHETHALVRSRLAIARNPKSQDRRAPLALDGDELELVSVALDGRPLSASDYSLTPEKLAIAATPDVFALEVVTRIQPRTNTKLMGLYASNGNLVTQCEAEGFRRITFFPDRPDVMALYQVVIHADRARQPVLLANGNLIAQGEDPGGRHWARWQDPFPKPSYLFAMVAGRFEKTESTVKTASGRAKKLQVWVETGKLDQAAHALRCLESAMRWDERVFGLELDLDQYMVVAVGDFNMGAMENKGLNIFNTAYVLARPDTATDGDYQNIDRVIAHEYFHNWTGNRVTCRDWFQLSLKEGLTVFRDQEYGADMYSRPVQRIKEVRNLRAAQFPEDAGPMAHPVRPASYIEISNFYTATVYEKGAEVVRMIHALIGAESFRKGMDLYFSRHDGQAVTTEDFVQAMADASREDLTQFKRWYAQAGTPVVAVSANYDAAARAYTLIVRQSCPPTPGQATKLPLHIPFAVGLVAEDGRDIPLRLPGESSAGPGTRVLSLKQEEQIFRFIDVPSAPIPSLARGFSAPIIVKHDYSEAALAHLMAFDSDPFNRWEAGQRLAVAVLLQGVEAMRAGREFPPPAPFIRAFGRILDTALDDPAFAAEAMSLPAENYLAEQMPVADPDAIHAARMAMRRGIAKELHGRLLSLYRSLPTPGPYSPDARASGRRALRNACLSYLMETDDTEIRRLCAAQLDGADNMTEAMAALSMLANSEAHERAPALARFYERWRHEALVLDKWFGVQATSRLPGTLDDVRRLMRDPAFDLRNPNKVRALISSFCYANQVRFHAAGGAGYAFCADQVIALDPINPHLSARLARAFDRWRKFDQGRQALMRAQLERIRAQANLSKDLFEVVSKSLG